MTESDLLTALDAIIADATVPRARRRQWSAVRTAVAKILGAQDRRGRPATVDRERIRALRADGRTHAEIAAQCGCGLATVNRVLRAE